MLIFSIILYILTGTGYGIMKYLLNMYSPSFSMIYPEHKKMYVVKNYFKSCTLMFLLCIYTPYCYYYNILYSIDTIRFSVIVYVMNDLLGLLLVDRLPINTLIHHCISVSMGIMIVTKEDLKLDVRLLCFFLGCISMISYSVNFYLAYRVYLTYYLSVLRISSLVIYSIATIINISFNINIIYYNWDTYSNYIFLYILGYIGVLLDDLLLLRWLYDRALEL